MGVTLEKKIFLEAIGKYNIFSVLTWQPYTSSVMDEALDVTL